MCHCHCHCHSLSVSGTTASWTSLNSQGDIPVGREVHTMTVLADGTVVLLGGYDGSNYLDDVYTLTVLETTASWVSLSSQGDTPSARSGHSMTALVDDTAVLFGGDGVDGILDGVATASPSPSPTPSDTASSNSTTSPTPPPTPSDELSASEHQHPFLSLLLELFAAS